MHRSGVVVLQFVELIFFLRRLFRVNLLATRRARSAKKDPPLCMAPAAVHYGRWRPDIASVRLVESARWSCGQCKRWHLASPRRIPVSMESFGISWDKLTFPSSSTKPRLHGTRHF